MTLRDAAPSAPAPRLVRRAGAILWPSFFAAGVATMAFFAYVDPQALQDMTFPALHLGRGQGYTLGFLLAWLATASSSLFTWVLLRPRKALRHAPMARGRT
ncbi:hypothetical protein [Fulvimonas soli]|jgi:hypothetical protein|uniref:Uncharacterized protein n=1 Tax=Fulvimonas soli TaxID=155197 RepID=A0A316HMD7_9GAMM|nr:hypothetical protein [Fulvimonas soli]PWK82377.1 hypothetical protein C7456_11623 [Fulvimonas soli]TNY26957.1 hypothetical protein BV497_06180 [Fulvimonas soli]